MGPLAPEVYRAPFPQDYRGPSTPRRARRARAALRHPGRGRAGGGDRRRARAGRGRLRPGAAGVHAGRCARICDEHGIVLVVDEVQTGFARTGKFFAIEHYGDRARPDHGREVDRRRPARSPACSARPRSWTRAHDGAVGGTFVGNPVAQAAALAVLDVIEEEGLVERADEIGETMRAPHARAGRSAAARSATCAGSARCWRSSSSRDRATKAAGARARGGASSRRPPQRGLLLLKAGHLLELHPRPRARS